MNAEVIAIDVGGTKIAMRAYTPDAQVLRRLEIPTDSLPRGRADFLPAVIRAVRGFAGDAVLRLGVAWNCPIRAGVAAHSSLLGGAAGTDLREAFRAAFAVGVKVESDVHAMTLGHASFGDGVGVNAFCVLNLGTGVGLGCWDSGLRRGRGAAGLVCNEPIWIAESAAYWRVDDALSGRGISALHSALGGRPLAPQELVQQARHDTDVRRTLDLYARNLAGLMVTISRTFDPELIIIDGSVRHAWPQIGSAVLGYYRNLVEPFMWARIIASGLDASACLGVAFDAAVDRAGPA